MAFYPAIFHAIPGATNRKSSLRSNKQRGSPSQNHKSKTIDAWMHANFSANVGDSLYLCSAPDWLNGQLISYRVQDPTQPELFLNNGQLW